MSNLEIPVVLEKNFALENGSTEGGFPVARGLQLNEDSVDNLYAISDGQFKFSFQEHGVAYGETEATDYRVEVSLPIPAEKSTGFTMKVDQRPVQMWGVNFAARVLVNHAGSGKERVIYIPGTRTYDPAGLTGKNFGVLFLLIAWGSDCMGSVVVFALVTHSVDDIVNLVYRCV